jgi:AAA domain/CHC2 zinc finger
MYSEAYLADLKSRVTVSDVVGRSIKLRKDGKEFRAIDNASLTVNDAKALWFDHATNEGGDALAWLQKMQGLSFTDAVAEIASMAGVPLPNGDGQARQPQPKKQQAAPPTTKRKITATYDYADAQGELIYQVVRMEDGERQKTFRQRRPDPEKPNEWLWNLEGVKHGLYRLPELRETGADEVVYLPEGEKDVETMSGFGLCATTNSGGAKNWRQDHAEHLRGRDVVVLVDADDPGRERGQAIATSLHGIARRVRVLDFSHPDIWPTAPKGADISDWVKAREGTAEDLAAIVETLPDAKPAAAAHDDEPPPPSGPDDYGEQIKSNATPHAPRQLRFTQFSKIQLSTRARYLVKGIIPNVGLVVVWGEPKCGKSFQVFDMAAHIAAGWEYRGRRVKHCPVVYFALEGQEGFVARVEAFRRAHNVADIPFYLSADRIVLPQDGAAVVQSIRAQFPGVKPGVVVLDTLNRSLGGSENDPSDMGQYVRAADMIREAFNCVVIVIHHCGVEGARPRGHTSLTGAADAQIAVKRDDAGNIVATVEFMKDGPQGDEIVSRLEQVIVGTDDDGDSITSCVIRPADASISKAKKKVTGPAAIALRILQDSIIEEGETPPQNTHIPPNTRTIAEKTWRANCYAGMSQDDTTRTARQKAFVRASNKLQELKLIGKYGDHVWLV